MTLQVVGAGLGRTGTTSLRLALQRLLAGPCYHMLEVFPRPDHVAAWHRAALGRMPDWHSLFTGFVAAVDWPTSGFWPELCDAFPDAVVLLSVRESPEVWWTSASRTILQVAERRDVPPEEADWFSMYLAFLEHRFTPQWRNPSAAMDAYTRHNEAVRAGVPPGRLVEWRPGDGWEPLCRALRRPVPRDDFPRTNTTAEFRARAGWDEAVPN
jgi:Sulfotransferase domain